MYSSKASEIGRGKKVTKFSAAPDDTPAPDAYTLKSDFVNQKHENEKSPPPVKTNMDGNLPTQEEIAARSPPREIPWNQKGFEYVVTYSITIYLVLAKASGLKERFQTSQVQLMATNTKQV